MVDQRTDLTHPDNRENGISGELKPGANGYLRAVFTETTRLALQELHRRLISTSIKEHEAITARRNENIQAYEAQAEPDKAITLPVVKRDLNQQLAWLSDAVFSKDPMFTVRALDNDPIRILVEDSPGQAHEEIVPADEYAKQLQALVNFYTVHKIKIKKVFRTWWSEMLRDGNRPPILKVVFDPQDREYGGLNVVRNADGVLERIEKDPVYRTVKDGEAVRIENVPGEKFYVPFPWDDIQRAPLVFQQFEESVVTIKDKIARKEYDFCRDGDADPLDVDTVISGSHSRDQATKWRADGRSATEPTSDQKLCELWFDYPFAELIPGTEATPPIIDPATQAVLTPGVPATEPKSQTRMVPMCAVIHEPSGLWLNCYENHRWDRMRPFFVGRMQDRPFSFSGYSTAENVAPFQRLMSQLFNARLQNIAVANVPMLGLREGSPTWRFFAKNRSSLRPGTIFPFTDPNDFKPESLGRNVESTAPEMGFLNSEAEKVSTVYDYDRGQVPNRTPVGTVEAVDSLAKMQPRMVLDQVRETVSDLLACLVRTLAQFYPGGMRVPFRDPRTRDLVEVKVVGFPVEWREGVFTFDITATGNEETAQSLTMRDLMLNAEISKYDGDVMGMVAATMTPNPQTGLLPPPPLVILGTEMLKGRRNMLARVFEHNKLNPDDYLPPLAMIEDLPIQLMKLQQLAQATAPQGGIDSGLLPAGPADAIPSPEGGGEAVPFVEGEPGDGGVDPRASPPNL